MEKVPPLQSRKCACGCGMEFRCLPCSTAKYASAYCEERTDPTKQGSHWHKEAQAARQKLVKPGRKREEDKHTQLARMLSGNIRGEKVDPLEGIDLTKLRTE